MGKRAAGTGHGSGRAPTPSQQADEGPSSSAPAPGPDNNKRLAFLEGEFAKLSAGVSALAITLPEGGFVDGLLGKLSELSDAAAEALARAGDAEAGRSQLFSEDQKLAVGLAAVEGFQPVQGETSVDMALRLIGELGADGAAAAGEVEVLAAFLSDRAVAVPDGRGYAETAIALIAALDARIAEIVPAPATDDVVLGEKDAAEAVERAAAVKAAGAAQAKAEKSAAAATEKAEATARDEAREAFGAAVAGEVPVYGDLGDGEGEEKTLPGLTIRLAEPDGFIPSLPAREVTAGEIELIGGRASYTRAIDLPPDGPPHRVTAAWLIGGAKAVRCEIPGGINVGGGNMGRIPAGHLLF